MSAWPPTPVPAPYSVAEFAQQAMAAAQLHADGQIERCRQTLREPARRLMARDDLTELGLPRPGNNVAESWYLYYDTYLSIILFKVPESPAVQPHDHGNWETLFVYRGRVRHRVYERLDDGSQAGRAQLRECASGVLQPGDFAFVAPPQDIHGFEALDDQTYGITVSAGPYKSERTYYNLAEGSCELRRPRTLR